MTEIKIKEKYLGKILKGGGITIVLDENIHPRDLELAYNRFGKEYFTTKRNAKNTKKSDSEHNTDTDGENND